MTNNLDAIFSAMGDPTRRAVIEQLVDGPHSVKVLHAPHDIALPTFLKHLKVLEDSGLVASKKTGRVRMVHLERDPFDEMESWLRRHRDMWSNRLSKIAALAETMERTRQ